MVQLESYREQFESIGVNVAGMTYDSLEILSSFHAEQDLGYPMLRDEQAKHANALGIRDEQYGEDHPAYGIPHPGIVYIDSAGTIRAKFAVPGYRQRPPFEPLLEHIKTLVK